MLISEVIQKQIVQFLEEDDVTRNLTYMNSLPADEVACQLKVKSPLVLSGLPFFFAVFKALGSKGEFDGLIREWEGRELDNQIIDFKMPFNIALNAERVALNLVQHSSSISTFTKKFVDIASEKNIRILDTRKTTPGLRWLEKYATNKGGAYNHRFAQTDMWMVKDNHKSFFGGVEEAVQFFKNQKVFYNPILLEVHDLKELEQGLGLGVKHFMLDNFSPADIETAVKSKNESVTFEVSGGINLESLDKYCIEGVDAISVGSITYAAPPVDLSLKYGR